MLTALSLSLSPASMTNPSSRQCPSQVNSNFLSKSITRTACVFLAAETKVCFRGNHDFRQTPHSHDPQWHRALQPALKWTPYAVLSPPALCTSARAADRTARSTELDRVWPAKEENLCRMCVTPNRLQTKAGACNSVSAKARQREGACAVWV